MTHSFMNQALSSFSMPIASSAGAVVRRSTRQASSAPSVWAQHEESSRLRRLHSLLALFALYAALLLVVVIASEGADIGCILGGIIGHAAFTSRRVLARWRDAAQLEAAKLRARRYPRRP